LDGDLDLHQCWLTPWSASQWRLRFLGALFDALGIPVYFGSALGFASALAYALIGVAVVAAHFSRSLCGALGI
jgi:hypothetical protein